MKKGIVVLMLLACAGLAGCHKPAGADGETVAITDQLGREVLVPRHVERIAALHHFGGLIVYGLRQQDKLVEQALYGIEALAMEKVDADFAALPHIQEGHSVSIESLVGFRPQVAFVYASFDRSEMEQLENAGVKVVAVRGETLEESFAAVRLIGRVLNCPDKAEAYLGECQRIIDLVQARLQGIDKPQRVMFAGPKSVYTVATGEMLQTRMLERAGAVNVARGLRGFWGDVSPEQVAVWNPEAIFMGSTLATYGITEILTNPQFATVKAVRDKRVYHFPSNIGWWDYPAPHCVLGVLWSAKTLYPERFADIDMIKVADDFYTRFLGHSFSEMGGRL